jgi:hypothetical protein
MEITVKQINGEPKHLNHECMIDPPKQIISAIPRLKNTWRIVMTSLTSGVYMHAGHVNIISSDNGHALRQAWAE